MNELPPFVRPEHWIVTEWTDVHIKLRKLDEQRSPAPGESLYVMRDGRVPLKVLTWC